MALNVIIQDEVDELNQKLIITDATDNYGVGGEPARSSLALVCLVYSLTSKGNIVQLASQNGTYLTSDVFEVTIRDAVNVLIGFSYIREWTATNIGVNNVRYYNDGGNIKFYYVSNILGSQSEDPSVSGRWTLIPMTSSQDFRRLGNFINNSYLGATGAYQAFSFNGKYRRLALNPYNLRLIEKGCECFKPCSVMEDELIQLYYEGIRYNDDKVKAQIIYEEMLKQISI